MHFLDKLMASVAVQRLVPGRDSADTVEVPLLLEVPVEIPKVQFLDKFDTPVMRVFFDKVVDGPVVHFFWPSHVPFVSSSLLFDVCLS